MLNKQVADALNIRNTDDVLIVGKAIDDLAWIGVVNLMIVAKRNDDLKIIRHKGSKFEKVVVAGDLAQDECAVINSISVSRGFVSYVGSNKKCAELFSSIVQRNYPTAFVWESSVDGTFIVSTSAVGDPDWMVENV